MIEGSVVLLVLGGLAVGAFSAGFGVGGGTIMVPLLVLAFGETQHTAEGVSLVVIVPVAVVGVVSLARHGLVHFRIALLLGAAGSLGAIVGAVAALTVEGQLLARIFGGFLVYAGVRLVLRRSDGPAEA